MSPIAIKEHAHQLIDQMEPAQLFVLVGMLEDILDPLTAHLAKAPLDDEPTTNLDSAAIIRSHTATIPSTQDFLNSFGLTAEDFYRLADDSNSKVTP